MTTVYLIEIKSSYYEDKLFEIHDTGYYDRDSAEAWKMGYELKMEHDKKIALPEFSDC